MDALRPVSHPLVSAVIVNHNAGPLLQASIATCLAQAGEVVLIDNASQDGSLEAAAARFGGDPRLKIIALARNVGFAAACNHGYRAAEGRYVLFLNPDCVLGEHVLVRLVAALASDPRAGMAGGLLLNPDGSEQAGGRRLTPTPWRACVHAFGLDRLARFWPALFPALCQHRMPLPVGAVDVEAISGAFMLVRRTAADEIGLWDERYFLHCEDLDWCLRFRRAGWKILFVPHAPAWHAQGACSRARPFFVEWHKHRGMRRYYRKFFRSDYPGVLMCLVDAGVWLRLGLSFVLQAGRAAVRRGGWRHG